MKQPVICIGHKNCYDGFGSLYSAWKALGDKAVYLESAYGEEIPSIEPGSRVYIMDFSYPKDVLQKLSETCQVVVLDHHKTAEENLKGFPELPELSSTHDPFYYHSDSVKMENGIFVFFDMNYSGAYLSWKFFHPDTEVPMLIQYLSDRDLWKFELPQSKEVSAALQSYPFDFKIWDNFDIETLKKEGVSILRYFDVLIDMICKQTRFLKIEGNTVPVVNSTSHWAEVGDKLCSIYDPKFALSFWFDKNDMVILSFRSRGDFDVSEIAKKYGGGGHKNAAGARITKEQAMEMGL